MRNGLNIFLCLFFCLCIFSETRAQRGLDSANVKYPYGIYFALGPSYSSVDIYSNYLVNPRRFGINPRLYAEFSNSFRIAAGYTFITPFNFAPTWKNVRSGVTDVDLHVMARVKDEYSIVYLITGLCYNEWKGFYIKQSLFYDATKNYIPNTTIQGRWYGINIGIGAERAFKHFDIFLEYKYRFTKKPDAIGIADVSGNIGIKKKIPLRKFFKGLRGKYNWF